MIRRAEFARRLSAKLHKLEAPALRQKIEELLEDQAFLEGVLAGLREGVLVATLSGDLLYANPAACNLLALDAEALAANGKLPDLLSDERELRDFVANALANPEASFAEIVDLLHPRPFTASVAARPIRGPAHEVAALLVLIDNRTRERDETRALSQLEKIESLMNLASAVAHELGNPLNAILIHLRLLADGLRELPARRQKKLLASVDTLLAETRRLDAIVKHFLGATRRRQKPLVEASLQDVIEEVCQVLAPELRAARVRLTLKQSRKVPRFLMDAERIHEAVLNLVRNAIQAMPRGGRLTVSTDCKGDVASLAVADNGAGIPARDLPRLFEGTFTTKHQGSGLGLLITHGIVREHGGRIRVASRQGSGSTFTVELPIRRGTLQLPARKTMERATP